MSSNAEPGQSHLCTLAQAADRNLQILVTPACSICDNLMWSTAKRVRRERVVVDLFGTFHGVACQRPCLRADSDGLLVARRLRALPPASSARACDRCRPDDRLVRAQRRDPTDLFAIWVFAYFGGRHSRGLRSRRQLFVVAAATGGRNGTYALPFRRGRSRPPLSSRFCRQRPSCRSPRAAPSGLPTRPSITQKSRSSTRWRGSACRRSTR